MSTYDDEYCPSRGPALKHVRESGKEICAFCRSPLTAASLRPSGRAGDGVTSKSTCRYLVCYADGGIKTFRGLRHSDAGTLQAITVYERLCDEHTQLIRVGLSGGLRLIVTTEGWLYMDNLNSVTNGV